MSKTPITVAYGDGIGPEIMQATLDIIREAGAQLEIHEIEIGEKVYERGFNAGIEDKSWDLLRDTKVFLKAPITTPQGGGFKSLNVTIRKTLGMFANIRPTRSLYPFVNSKHHNMDLVIVRENEEDLYAGIEHRQTDDVYQCLKLISRSGSEKIIRYAFEYAVQNKRKKVSCFTKDNIMKMTDGLFHKVFEEVAKEYPQIETEHWIIDIGTAKMADTPENFDVIVLQNLYGDILSDVAAQIAGSVGLAGSANIGEHGAMFEAIHGSAPRRAGQNLANPSGLLLGAIQMLVHIGQADVAERVHNAWLRTIEDGVHTYDIYDESSSTEKVGTKEFAKAVIQRMGQKPEKLKPVEYNKEKQIELPKVEKPAASAGRQLRGMDMFVCDRDISPNALAEKLQAMSAGLPVELKMISNRGLTVWPAGKAETFCTDHWRCRFRGKDNSKVEHSTLAALMTKAAEAGIDFIKSEGLYYFDDKPGFSLGQGE